MCSRAGWTGSVGTWTHRREPHRAPAAPLVAIRAADTAAVEEGAGRKGEAGRHDKWARAMAAESEPRAPGALGF